MDIENNPPQIPPGNELPPENQTPEIPTAAAAPPATAIVIAGKKTEREIELEQRLADAGRDKLDRERRIMELERDKEELRKIPSAAPVKKVKREKWLPTFLDDDNED